MVLEFPFDFCQFYFYIKLFKLFFHQYFIEHINQSFRLWFTCESVYIVCLFFCVFSTLVLSPSMLGCLWVKCPPVTMSCPKNILESFLWQSIEGRAVFLQRAWETADTIIGFLGGAKYRETPMESAGQQGGLQKGALNEVDDRGVDSPGWAPLQ